MNRLTRCNFAVDETTAAQRASHSLREAAFCPKCEAHRLPDDEICFTARGKRRHWTAAQ